MYAISTAVNARFKMHFFPKDLKEVKTFLLEESLKGNLKSTEVKEKFSSNGKSSIGSTFTK